MTKIPKLSRLYGLAVLSAIAVTLASTAYALAERSDREELKSIAARVIPSARVELVLFDKIETKAITPNVEASSPPMLVGQVSQFRWTQSPDSLFTARDFLAPRVKTSYFKSTEQILSPRYKNRRCKDRWNFIAEVLTDRQQDGEHRLTCSEDKPDGSGRTQEEVLKERVSSPPDIEVDSLIGTYEGSFPVSSGLFTEAFEANVKSRTQLTFNGPPGKMYWVDVKLSLESGALNEVTRTLQFTQIPCKGIRIGSATTDKNCVARILIQPSRDPTLPNVQVLDITPPSIPKKVLRYGLSIAAGPQEK